MQALQAVEFFSGIGGFAEACRNRQDLKVIGSFDQSEQANQVYMANFGAKPNAHNLDSLKDTDVPKADLWWLSPPCTPYSRRGKTKDVLDARAKSFLNLIDLLAKFCPRYLLLENVLGFSQSEAHNKLTALLTKLGYSFQELELCPTMFGVPMKRPRYFLLAEQSNRSIIDGKRQLAHALNQDSDKVLSTFLDTCPDPKLFLDQDVINRFGDSLNIIDPSLKDAYAICFTSNYWKCLKASGSFVQDNHGKVRRFSDREILKLFGFSEKFTFPDNIDLKTRLRLLGNSLDIRSVNFALETLLSN